MQCIALHTCSHSLSRVHCAIVAKKSSVLLTSQWIWGNNDQASAFCKKLLSHSIGFVSKAVLSLCFSLSMPLPFCSGSFLWLCIPVGGYFTIARACLRRTIDQSAFQGEAAELEAYVLYTWLNALFHCLPLQPKFIFHFP